MHAVAIIALIGGALIGIATAIMLIFNGRVTGISGIVNGMLPIAKDDFFWRFAFLCGLLCGGIFLRALSVNFFSNNSGRPIWSTIVAGLLVGFGTVMGSGCTSGHGVCGLSRLSPRSILATIVFLTCGFISATFFGVFFSS